MKHLTAADERLLFPNGNMAAFWNMMNTSPDYQVYVDEIRSEGARLLSEPIQEISFTLFALFEREGSRLDVERVYFEKRRRLNTMVFLSLLEPKAEVYQKSLHDILWSICNEYTWCLPAHLKNSLETCGDYTLAANSTEWSRGEVRTAIDLFSAETGFALSEILCLTGTDLPPLLRSRIREEVTRRLFKPYLMQGHYHWEKAEHNWSAVCAGSIGSAALLLLENNDELTAVLEKVFGSLDCYLAGFGEDGACLEGVGYWNYGFGYYVYFADLLKKRTQGAINLFQQDKIHQIALFQQKCYLTDSLTVNFSDSVQHVYIQVGLTHYLAGLFPDIEVPSARLIAAYKDDHCSRWAPALRNLIWFDPDKKSGEWTSVDYYLNEAEWFVSRYLTATGSFGFAAKGGSNDEPHNHNDLGGFILASDGEPFVAELGCGEYTADYFGAGRYNYACNGSIGHSVPILEGLNQMEGEASKAAQVEISINGQEASFELDIAGAYRNPHLKRLKRRFTWVKSEHPLLRLEDEYEFTISPGSIVERFITFIPPQMEGDDCVILQGKGGRRLRIYFDPLQLQPSIGKNSYRNHSGYDTDWYSIDLALLKLDKVCTSMISFNFCEGKN
jgi:hypothetical protein